MEEGGDEEVGVVVGEEIVGCWVVVVFRCRWGGYEGEEGVEGRRG